MVLRKGSGVNQEKEIVRAVVRDYLQRESSDQAADFDVAFDPTYRSVQNHLSALEVAAVEGREPHLRFGPEILSASAIFLATVAALLQVRQARRDVSVERLERLLERTEATFADFQEEVAQIRRLVEREVRKAPQDQSARPLAGAASDFGQVDLLWRIELATEDGRDFLSHRLDFPSGAVPHPPITARTAHLGRREPQALQKQLFRDMEAALAGRARDGEPLFGREILDAVVALGENLTDRLVPADIQEFFELALPDVNSILLISDDDGIPWEVARLGPVDRREFLCLLADLGRSASGQQTAYPLRLQTNRLLAAIAANVEGFSELTAAREEIESLEKVVGRLLPEQSRILKDPSFGELIESLQDWPPDLFHFAGHNDARLDALDSAGWVLKDRRLHPTDLTAATLRAVASKSPFVFLNSCRAGLQGRALTGTGGWADRWMRIGKAGALLCPQWAVADIAAFRFSKRFYRRLVQEPWVCLGKAIRETRQKLLKDDPENPTPLAYAYFGHPGTAVGFSKGISLSAGSSHGGHNP